MRIGVFGTGMVGRAIAGKLVQLGHEVRMGSRTSGNPKAREWVEGAGPRASEGSFQEAAQFGELLFNCTSGAASLQALQAAGEEALGAKVLVDVANPLDFSRGMPPTLLVCNTDSLGEQLQRAFPRVRVVKTLNTVNADIMVEPGRVPGEHDVFLSGNDAEAKAHVVELLRSFGWRSVVDLGDITTARGTESYLALWVRLWGALGNSQFNIRVVR